jgi:hypothetical protein
MKSNNVQENNKSKSLKQALQNKTDNQSVSAQKDGYRYDYNDFLILKTTKCINIEPHFICGSILFTKVNISLI